MEKLTFDREIKIKYEFIKRDHSIENAKELGHFTEECEAYEEDREECKKCPGLLEVEQEIDLDDRPQDDIVLSIEGRWPVDTYHCYACPGDYIIKMNGQTLGAVGPWELKTFIKEYNLNESS